MRYIKTGFALLIAVTAVAEAQQPDRGRGRRGGPPGDSGMVAVRRAIQRLIREQVQPTDAQMRDLQAIDSRFEPRKMALNRDEQGVRRELRQALMDTTNVDQARVGQLLDRMVAFPGRRAALMEEEQKALAGVLSPVQRAKYHAIQEQLRRRIEQGRGGPGRAGQPPGRPGRPPERK
jgi:Spy/CpxP family protein refolding chaperone